MLINTVSAQSPTRPSAVDGVTYVIPTALRIEATLSHPDCTVLNLIEGHHMGKERLQAAMPQGVIVVRRVNLRCVLDVAWNPRTETADEAQQRGIDAYNAAMESLLTPSPDG